MNFKEFMHKFISNVSSWWKKGSFQKTMRISYDVIWNVILFFIVIGVIGMFFAGGVGAGYFASLVKDEEIRPRTEMEKDIYNYEETSELYFADNVFLGEIRSDLYRDEVKLENVSDNIKHAIIATEDEYFETHKGVVPKAILRAIYQEATNASVKTGGSTLTQQLIKNQILTNEVSFERKAKEILLAMRLERFFDKDEILEAYLNIVPFGRNSSGQNIAGVQTAAQGIFGVDAKDINLPQAAFIAGLPQSPSYYTPFLNGGELKTKEGLEPGLTRMKSVLSRMLEGGYITKNEYNEALNYDIVADFIEPKESTLDKYPYLTNEIKKRAAEILLEVLAKEDGYTTEDLENSDTLREEYYILAQRELSKSGYKIHSTIDKKIYDKFQEIAANYDNYGRDKPVIDRKTGDIVKVENPETGEMETLIEPVQVGSILIENTTGKILSFVGGRDFNLEQMNHATNSKRQNGSTMKPLLVYAPAMEAGVIQPGSVIADIPSWYSNGTEIHNYTGGNYGLVSVREALYKSHNVPAVKTYQQILANNPAKNYLEKMGFTSLFKSDYEVESIAIGGMTKGVTVEENTNAYATFGNGGQFVDAYLIEKIETVDGEVIYQHEQPKPVHVFSPETNYLMLDMMRDVLTRGTATVARANISHTNVDWAGKTGTTNEFRDTWFVATNPNVTIGSWMGYDSNMPLDQGRGYTSYSSRNVIFWSKLVNAATEIKPDLMAPSQRFERPDGIVSRSYCATSGLAPSDICSELGLVRSDIYNAKYVPNKTDDSLIKDSYVMINGKAVVAGENTPEEFTKGDGVAFNPDWLKRNNYDRLSNIKVLIPNQTGVWANIQVPSTNEIKNDGKNPATPNNVKKAGNALTWSKSGSNDVVGYRIYRAANPDSTQYSLVGSTTDLKFNISNSKAVYQVKAVDYFGQESAASVKVEVGDFTPEPEPEPEEPAKPKKDKPTKPEKPDSNSDNQDGESTPGNTDNTENDNSAE
ncbi:transglycosylase domain-containing protein [Aquibacillus kalidii]|uniref:transglycosylase domain-containing protein n=1 Tax=Aquibacillus kalidii TaxID=2762597 RepID=UPI001647F6C5|nr:transglycosylase domain-containing protein [Aquibacillus kalidii]